MNISDSTCGAPLFSVVTCCYNQGEFLADNIESVLAQQEASFEHIVIDSGNDQAKDVCGRYPHVRYVFQPPAGQSAALNLGFELARGEIIAWLNADDYYLPGAFARVKQAFAGVSSRTLVGGEANVVNAEGGFMWKLKNGSVPFYRLLAHPLLYRLEGRCAIPCQPTVFFPRRLLAVAGPLRCDLKYGMDYEFWLRAIRCGYRFRHIKARLACYRYHGSSLTASEGYEAFLPEWQAVSDTVCAALPRAKQAVAKLWNAYFHAESFLYRRHQRGMSVLDTLRASDRAAMPKQDQAGKLATALLHAPWLLADMFWRTCFRRHP